MMLVFAIVAMGLLIHSLLELQREREEAVLFVDAVTGMLVALTVLYLLLENRRRISQAIYRSSVQYVEGTSLLRAQLAEYWHVLAIPHVIVFWCLWLAYLLSNDVGFVYPVFCLLASVPAFLILDLIGQKAIDGILGLEPALKDRDGEASKAPPDSPPGSTSRFTVQRFVPKIRRLLSLSLAAAIFFFLLRTWGFDVAMGDEASRAAFEIIVVVMVAYVAWRLVEDAINRKLEKIGADHVIEVGNRPPGGSRIGTLLHLLRTSVIVVLAMVIVFISLSAVGVHIGPLLAAAGVVGIAVGFGAQTLVKDIISGILFIVEDAFRIGDFVESGKFIGIVERISIRSLRLRHRHGMVYTIPFSALGVVTNYSRDYTIMNLDFRVPHETKVETVRRVVQKLDEELQADGAFGPKLLDRVKLKGVKEIDDIGILMQIKFKTRPGDQRAMGREIFERLQRRFEENGIQFARRQLIIAQRGIRPSKIVSAPTVKEGGILSAGAFNSDSSLKSEDGN